MAVNYHGKKFYNIGPRSYVWIVISQQRIIEKIGEKSSAATTKYEEWGTCVYYN